MPADDAQAPAPQQPAPGSYAACPRHNWLLEDGQDGTQPCPECAFEAASPLRAPEGQALRKSVHEACEEIDAAIFSGDVLWKERERNELRAYVERWTRAIEEQIASEG